MSDLKFSKEHTWARVDGNTAVIGISSFAQEELGDIVFIGLPEAGEEVAKGKAFGTIESVKAVSDLSTPLSGTVTEINELLDDEPETVNDDPCEGGWIIKIDLSNPSEIESLLSNEEYSAFIEESKG